MGVNVQRRGLVRRSGAYVAHLRSLSFPDVNRPLLVSAILLWASCGPPSWQGGIHAQLAWSHKGVRVVEIPVDSPARRAGLQENDWILSVDGRPLSGLPVERVHELLSGQVGSTVTMEVLRGAEPLTLQIAREPYEAKGVEQ